MINIGVSASFFYPDENRQYFPKKTLCFIENDMANYLYRQDIMPILIPDLPQDKLRQFLAEMDGFVLQGGSDISPKSYGEEHLDEDRWPGDEPRDKYELKIIDYAYRNQKPILGICRGAQLLNVYFGGTLYQDIASQCPKAIKHHDKQLYDKNYHEVEFIQGSLFDNLYQSNEIEYINSVHHQGVKELAKPLVIEAISPKDKFIEAFSYQDMDKNFILGVQWHPEFSASLQGKLISADKLYDYFISTVKRKSK